MSKINELPPRKIEIHDTTLRDGLQSRFWIDTGKIYPTSNDRLEIAAALMRFGIRYIEVFSPNVNEGEAEDLGRIIQTRDEVQNELGKPIHILVHARCDPKDTQAALKYNIDGFNLYFGLSRESQKDNHGYSVDEIITKAEPLIAEIRRNYPDLILRFSGEDAFRSDLDDIFRVYDSIAPWVDRFGFPDTVGVANPHFVEDRLGQLMQRYPGKRFEGHFHNDTGLALINALTAFNAGMKDMQTTILGFAERSGIVSMSAFLLNLYRINPDLLEGYNIGESYLLNVLLASIMKTQVPPNEPVSLTNRTHSAGVHAKAVLNNAKVYEAHPLQEFGVTERKLLLGPLSGVHIIQYTLAHILNFQNIPLNVANEVTRIFKNRTSRIKPEETILGILEEIAISNGLKKQTLPVTHIEKLDNGG